MNGQDESRALALRALNEAPPASLLRAPLDQVFAEHFRQRCPCRVLDEIAAEDVWDREKAAAALRFLRGDFDLHRRDEQEDLFVMLRKRLRPQDGIADMLRRLGEGHSGSAAEAAAIADALAAALETGDGRGPAPLLRVWLCDFSTRQRRRLIEENAFILPFARARLSRRALETLGRRMAARRGIAWPGDDDAD